MRVIIVMTYYNREKLLLRTLNSISSEHNDFEIVIVDDGSEPKLVIPKFKYPFQINVIRIEKEKKWRSHVAAINKGLAKAIELGADIIITQNAEARHFGDIIDYVVNNLTQENYISFACFSLSKQNTFRKDLDLKIQEIITANNICAVDSEHDSWYNHPYYRGTAYDFCAAITTENMIKLNGHDERYSEGYCYSDDDLVMRIKRLGLKIEIPINPFVAHQWHPSSGHAENFSELTIKNRNLYLKITQEEKDNYKAVHTQTPDL